MSTDGVLGRPNNWRSLDSRAHGAANSMPTLNANSVYRREKSDSTLISSIYLFILSKTLAPSEQQVLHLKEKPKQLALSFWSLGTSAVM